MACPLCEMFKAEMAISRDHFDAVYSRNVFIEAELSTAKAKIAELDARCKAYEHVLYERVSVNGSALQNTGGK